MSLTEKILIAIGGSLTLLGLYVLLFGVLIIFDPLRTPTIVEYIGLGMFGIIPTVVGALMCRKLIRQTRSHKGEIIEKIILQLAKKNRGSLTVAEVAMNTPLTSVEAKKVLDQYNLNGLTEMEVSESGVVIYRFRGIISDEERNHTERI